MAAAVVFLWPFLVPNVFAAPNGPSVPFATVPSGYINPVYPFGETLNDIDYVMDGAAYIELPENPMVIHAGPIVSINEIPKIYQTPRPVSTTLLPPPVNGIIHAQPVITEDIWAHPSEEAAFTEEDEVTPLLKPFPLRNETHPPGVPSEGGTPSPQEMVDELAGVILMENYAVGSDDNAVFTEIDEDALIPDLDENLNLRGSINLQEVDSVVEENSEESRRAILVQSENIHGLIEPPLVEIDPPFDPAFIEMDHNLIQSMDQPLEAANTRTMQQQAEGWDVGRDESDDAEMTTSLPSISLDELLKQLPAEDAAAFIEEGNADVYPDDLKRGDVPVMKSSEEAEEDSSIGADDVPMEEVDINTTGDFEFEDMFTNIQSTELASAVTDEEIDAEERKHVFIPPEEERSNMHPDEQEYNVRVAEEKKGGGFRASPYCLGIIIAFTVLLTHA